MLAVCLLFLDTLYFPILFIRSYLFLCFVKICCFEPIKIVKTIYNRKKTSKYFLIYFISCKQCCSRASLPPPPCPLCRHAFLVFSEYSLKQGHHFSALTFKWRFLFTCLLVCWHGQQGNLEIHPALSRQWGFSSAFKATRLLIIHDGCWRLAA